MAPWRPVAPLIPSTERFREAWRTGVSTVVILSASSNTLGVAYRLRSMARRLLVSRWYARALHSEATACGLTPRSTGPAALARCPLAAG